MYTLTNIRNTNPWTIETISSNTPNAVPTIQAPICILQINVSKTCPALILANSRKHRVIGRTEILTISIKHKKGAKYQGELDGKNDEATISLLYIIIILLNQVINAMDKLNLKVVVTGYL